VENPRARQEAFIAASIFAERSGDHGNGDEAERDEPQAH
jgi:hypothetical protein